jgi:hypothetical protein
MVKGWSESALIGLLMFSSCTSRSDSHAAKPDFAKAMKKLNADYAKGYRDFSIEFTSVASKRVGGIPESETRLQVDGHGTAELFRRDSPGNSPDYPPGQFTGRIPDTSMREVLRLMETGPFESQPREFFGPWDPLEKLTLRSGKQSYSFSLGSSRKPPPAAMVKVFNHLVNWTFRAYPNVVWCLNFKAEGLVFKQGRLSARIKLENPGQTPVRVLHPLSRSPTAKFGIRLDYGEEQLIEEGYTPAQMDIKVAAPEGSRLDSLKWIEIKAGNPFVMDVALRLEGKAPRGWIGIFYFNHHLEPDSSRGAPVFSGILTTGEVKW